MTSKTKFKSVAFEAIHSAAQGLHRAGTIDKATMREFDESCLTAPPAIPPEEIKRIREGAHVSQPVFARYLNTSESTVQKWEAGTKRPSGMALKLLAVVEKHGLKVLA
jgi:putative transcriptional regulator